VRETFKVAVLISAGVMFLETILCQFESDFFIHIFTTETAVVAVGVQMLVISSWNFVANGIIFCCSSMFQALGNTWPTIASSALRLVIFIGPALWLSTRPGFELHHLWYVSVATMFVQAGVSYLFLRREFARKLPIAA
jgi:Na+-driven multidrug efflux pump